MTIIITITEVFIIIIRRFSGHCNATAVTTLGPNYVQTCFGRRRQLSVTVGNRKQVAWGCF